MSTVSILQRYGATVLHTSGLKGSRHILDMFADRVRQASVEPTLMAFGQSLINLLDSAPSELFAPSVQAFIKLAHGPAANGALQWVRENHTLYAVLCASKFEPCPIRGWNKPPTHWMPFPDAPKEAAIVLPPCDCGSMGCDSCFNL